MSARVRPALVLALIFLAFHLPYLPKSLEDLDSINFALGVREYDITQHQPHPPGYPIYILGAKAIRSIARSELTALGVASVLAGALGVIAIGAVARRVLGSSPAADLGMLAAVTSPLYWFTAARPLSDVPGLAAALGVQALTLAADTPKRLVLASLLAGLATGVRSQVAWLTAPLLVVQAARMALTAAPGEWRRAAPAIVAHSMRVAAMFLIGVLLWFVPLLVVTGGPQRYWGALAFQGSADLGNIQMLWSHHRPRDVADALYYAFVAPWAVWPVAVIVLTLAVVGLAALAWRTREAVVLLAAAFGPYFVFDVLFQETFTSRYALPLVIPVALLAAVGALRLPWRSGIVVLLLIAVADAHAGGTSVAAFARAKAPAFRLLDDMRAAPAGSEAPVLAMDRKQSLDFRRPLIWVDGALPKFARQLDAPPQHEWLEAVKYWAGGGRAPVWFVVDPKRTMMDLVQHAEPVRYRWTLPHPVLVGGARPDEMDFYRVETPDWFVGEGWALTPEAAGIAEADHRGPSVTPIPAWVAHRAWGGALMIGGRNFSPEPATITIEAPDRVRAPLPPFSAPAGAFLHVYPPSTAQVPPESGYVPIRVSASSGSSVAIEQFDVSSARPIFGYGAGWLEQEFTPQTGQRWRWLSERGELRFASKSPRLTLRITGENPRTYFSKGSRLVARAGDRVIFDDVLTSDFAVDLPVPDGTEVISLETDQVFQPADRNAKSADRRHLGLRIFTCEVRPVS